MSGKLHKFALLALLLSASAFAVSWRPVGPDGGDVRSLAVDPRDPDHVLLGTSAGQLFASQDGGDSWQRLAQLGEQAQYVLDNIVFDRTQPGTIYVAAWNVEGSDSGDLFRSTDDGRSWHTIKGLHGKSIRAFAVAPSNSAVLVAGALDGLYRSNDKGANWQRISPENDAEIKNIESLAIDPRNPNVIYVGTWHLPWKTIDSGHTWISIKKGWIDDSDVFSIVLDPRNPDRIFASACTGVYSSDDAAGRFQKLKGIPNSARRTRKLYLHPSDGNIVFAGTTEGLYRSIDAGRTWKLISARNVIVNDIVVDVRRPGRVLLATDRSGIMRSENGGRSFLPSNRGFVHRQVAGLLVDHHNPAAIYAGVINDKDFGGVFVTSDTGQHWKQISDGLDGRDVFTLRQTHDGLVLAGTNRGLFYFDKKAKRWRPLNREYAPVHSVVRPAKTEDVSVISPIENARVSDIKIVDGRWYAATSVGLFMTRDNGRSWQGGPVLNERNFVAVDVSGKIVSLITPRRLLISADAGRTWYPANLPDYTSSLFSAAVDRDSNFWIATRGGAFRSTDGGNTWEHVLAGLPGRDVTSILYDREGARLLATAQTNCFESTDKGRSWHRAGESTWRMHAVTFGAGRIYVSSEFDGVLALPDETSRADASSGSGSSQ